MSTGGVRRVCLAPFLINMPIILLTLLVFLFQPGCRTLFGWEIHAPGLLSENYLNQVHPVPGHVGLYFPPDLIDAVSTDRGSRFADPQMFYVGEALAPMLVEGFQHGFSDFVFMESAPEPDIMAEYGVDYLVFVQFSSFNNKVTMKTQKSMITLDVEIYDRNLNLLSRFLTEGASEAPKVFSKKGGLEVNLNSAIENAIGSSVLYLQDAMAQNVWS